MYLFFPIISNALCDFWNVYLVLSVIFNKYINKIKLLFSILCLSFFLLLISVIFFKINNPCFQVMLLKKINKIFEYRLNFIYKKPITVKLSDQWLNTYLYTVAHCSFTLFLVVNNICYSLNILEQQFKVNLECHCNKVYLCKGTSLAP